MLRLLGESNINDVVLKKLDIQLESYMKMNL